MNFIWLSRFSCPVSFMHVSHSLNMKAWNMITASHVKHAEESVKLFQLSLNQTQHNLSCLVFSAQPAQAAGERVVTQQQQQQQLNINLSHLSLTWSGVTAQATRFKAMRLCVGEKKEYAPRLQSRAGSKKVELHFMIIYMNRNELFIWWHIMEVRNPTGVRMWGRTPESKRWWRLQARRWLDWSSDVIVEFDSTGRWKWFNEYQADVWFQIILIEH